ncbi:MAG: ABC transporter permease [Candidatus Acidiferrales bacterium]
MKDLWQDVRYGIRMLAKSPGFTAIAVLTLAVGVGANTAVFSVVNSFLFNPLPVRDASHLVVIAQHMSDGNGPGEISRLDFKDLEAQNNVLSDMTAYLIHFAGLSADHRSERVLVTYVEGNYFTSLGIQPALGRVFLPSEGATPGRDPYLVLGYSYWQRRFNGDSSVIGKTVDLNGSPVTIVGVGPKNFHGTFYIVESDVYAPLGSVVSQLDAAKTLTNRADRQMRALAHLRPGVSIAQAEASLQVIADRLEKEYPDTNKGLRMDVIPEKLARPEASSASMWPLIATVFLGLVGLVLIVTCVNVTNLLLSRASTRAKEMAIRAALGAGRTRMFRQLLTESLLLSLLGGAGGAALGLWIMKWIEAIRLPGDFPLRTNLPFDWRMFAYVASIAIVAGLLAGLTPAWRASRLDLNITLHESGRTSTGGAGQNRLRSVLVAAQAAGSLVVLIMAGLFLRSLERAQKMDLGFKPEHVLNFTMDVSQLGYDEQRGSNFYREARERVRDLPGVESASFAYSVPLGYYSHGAPTWKTGQEGLPESEVPRIGYNEVSPDYFRTMGIELVEGRAIEERDQNDSHRVAVINETMARKFWPGRDPIGQRFRFGKNGATESEIVGVVRDSKVNFIGEDSVRHFYVPLSQNYSPVRVLQVRANVAPGILIRAIEDQIHAIDPNLPVFDVMSMNEALQGGNGFFLLRIAAIFAGGLGALGLLLAVVGVYGVISYAVNQRIHEIGIRIALGAQRENILSLVLSQGLKLVLIGLAVGLAISLAVSRIVANLLVNTGAVDAVAYSVAISLLVAVATLACYIPARRAMRVDPLVALRYE